jgi:non-canonical poly(A) RNA polymerase PAPD5/7
MIKYPAIKYLVIIIKYFLKQRNLNEVFSGGLSSYSIFLLVLSHCQNHISNFDINVSKVTSLVFLF